MTTTEPSTELLPGISVHFMVLDPPLDRMAMLVEFLRPYVNEFVIVDTGTNPDSRRVMESWDRPEKPVRFVDAPFVDFSTTRNLGLAEHRHEWTLGIDPDEMPSPEMVKHMVNVTTTPISGVKGWLFWTKNFWGGIEGETLPYHWHCRLWKTRAGKLYRPIHELVSLDGAPEDETRGSRQMPFAPESAYLIHSKGRDEIERSDSLYRTIGEPSK